MREDRGSRTRSGSRRGAALRAMSLAASLLAASCSGDGPSPAEPAPDLTLSMSQLLPFQGSRIAVLRVDNGGPDPVTVTGVGLRWSGYGDAFLTPKDDTLAPGARLDLRVVLPREDCSAGVERPLGVVRTSTSTTRQPLTDVGEEFLRTLWARRCFVRTLEQQVSVSYSRTWSRDREPAALDGHLLVRRRAPGERLRFTRAVGSVLHRVDVVRPVVVAPDQPRAEVPVRIRPNNRCDEHAIGQATAPFAFKYGVEIGSGPEDLLVLAPPPALQQRIVAMLLDHCRRKGGVTR